MKRLSFAAALVLVALGGCQSELDKAKTRYRTAEQAKDKAAMCREGKKVADAFLSDGDASQYKEWSAIADTACLSHELDEQDLP